MLSKKAHVDFSLRGNRANTPSTKIHLDKFDNSHLYFCFRISPCSNVKTNLRILDVLGLQFLWNLRMLSKMKKIDISFLKHVTRTERKSSDIMTIKFRIPISLFHHKWIFIKTVEVSQYFLFSPQKSTKIIQSVDVNIFWICPI